MITSKEKAWKRVCNNTLMPLVSMVFFDQFSFGCPPPFTYGSLRRLSACIVDDTCQYVIFDQFSF